MDEFFLMNSFDLAGKTVYLRVDINAPVNPLTGEIMGIDRFKAHVDTIRNLRNSKVVIVAHQSRPGKDDFISLRQHAQILSHVLNKKVQFVDQLFGSQVNKAVSEMSDGDILMLENARFYSEEVDLTSIESMESSNIVKNLTPLFDYFVIDAFAAIHRAQTTLVGFHRIKPNIAGNLIEKEVGMIEKFRKIKDRPKIAILGGAKIEDSIAVSENFLSNDFVDKILTGGVVANAFLWASGVDIGKKNRDFIIKNNGDYEKLLEKCRTILSKYGDRVVMPTDFVMNPSSQRISLNEKIPEDQILADIGLDTIVQYSDIIDGARAIFMNGPMGMYEIEEYSSGTREIFNAVAHSRAFKLAGGGHTLSALDKLGLTKMIDHASTGGGALISYLSGETMPVLEALKESRRLFEG
ncbi:phosphoglycerate kinase [Thermoplasma sp. Kam2015]|uniref:phosphoglycerate kinase n=1 Tax=Thermoplasma sp. Kam2015 TaxID=2094122 RepID=UPI000D815284|nr:phosphoglycerate kinase [Thermoplasma sp. Kam2015]PYB67969.1 phosphoglycerate kinase [Thermoplasma sp. Kam2015]